MFALISFTNKQHFTAKFLVTAFLLLLITLPRFNRNTFIVNRPLNDAEYFKAYVEYFRGETPSYVIRPASNWRLLVPLMAAPLPFEPITAINIINLFCLALSLVFLYKSIQFLTTNNALSWIGCWLFIVSFPTFYYSTIGYIDPGVMLFMAMGIYFTLTQQYWGILLAVLLGALAKETIVTLLPFILVYSWFGAKAKSIKWTILLVILFVFINVLLRKYAYVTPGEKNPEFWKFSIDALKVNATRLNSYLAPLLSFGLPGILFVWLTKKQGLNSIFNNPLQLATCALLLGVLFLFSASAVATFCDGRIIWQAYYALIIAGMVGIEKLTKEKTVA